MVLFLFIFTVYMRTTHLWILFGLEHGGLDLLLHVWRSSWQPFQCLLTLKIFQVK